MLLGVPNVGDMTISTRTSRPRPHARITAAAFAAGALAPLLAIGSAAAGPSASTSTQQSSARGQLVSSAPVSHLDAAAARRSLRAQGYDSSAVRNGLDAYRLVYRTVDVAGRPTTASGLIALPRTRSAHPTLVSYSHGTMPAKEDGPSVDDNQARAAAEAFAAHGSVAVEADYLGLGQGPGRHPYMHLGSEVSASVDMLRAGARFARQHGQIVSREVRVSGFSQGGVVAVALGKALAAHADPYFRLGALVPISGPYDVLHAELPAAFDGRLDPKEAAFYLSYFLTSYNAVYHLYGNPAAVYRAPYSQFIDTLYDGTHTDEEIFAAIPADPQHLFTPAALRDLQHPTGRLAALVARNDRACRGWQPTVPVLLIAGSADRDVAVANAEHCRDLLRRNGSDVTLSVGAGQDHFGSQLAGVPMAIRWFERH